MNNSNDDIWQKILSKDEVIKEEFSISSKYIKNNGIATTILAGVLTMGIGSIFTIFYYFFYLKRANKYAFTNKRVLIYKGWLSTSLTSIDYSKITDTYVSEGWAEKVGTQSGTLKINTAGSGGEEVVLDHVANPYRLKRLLDELKD